MYFGYDTAHVIKRKRYEIDPFIMTIVGVTSNIIIYQDWQDQGIVVTSFKGSRLKFEGRGYIFPTNDI